MTDLAAKYENAPHALFVVVKTGSQELHIPVGTFPTLDTALTASAAAMKDADAVLAASALAGEAEITTMLTPAPANWQERLADVLTVVKEERDEHNEWVAKLRAGAL